MTRCWKVDSNMGRNGRGNLAVTEGTSPSKKSLSRFHSSLSTPLSPVYFPSPFSFQRFHESDGLSAFRKKAIRRQWGQISLLIWLLNLINTNLEPLPFFIRA